MCCTRDGAEEEMIIDAGQRREYFVEKKVLDQWLKDENNFNRLRSGKIFL